MDAISSNSILTAVAPKRAAPVRMKLTEQRIASLAKPSERASYVYDTVTPCLAIRVTSSGVRTFVVVKKVNGNAHRHTLGRFPGLRLDDARRAAQRFVGDLARGENPIAVRKAARARKVTLGDLWPSYLAT